MNLKKILTKKAFRCWLKKTKKRFVGIPQDSFSCPIANYLKETLKVRDVEVEHSCIGVCATSTPTSEWQKKFIDKVDDLSTAKVTPKQALEILN